MSGILHRGSTRHLFLVPALLFGLLFQIQETSAQGINLVPNGTLEKPNPTDAKKPMYWDYNSWGGATNGAFVYLTDSTGNHTVHTQIFSGSGTLPCTSGDAKWWTTPFTIPSGGGSYLVSDTFRSSVDSQLMVECSLASGGSAYVTVASPKASAGWTVLQNVVTIPAATTKVRLIHKICGSGFLETDNYVMRKSSGATLDSGPTVTDAYVPPVNDAGVPITDSGSGPVTGAVISVVFDDGWNSVHKEALPLMKQYGFRGTHFIHAEYVDKTGYTSEYMTSTKLKDIYNAGHEIGSHAMNREWADKDEWKDTTKREGQLSKSLTRLQSFGFDPKGFAPPGGEGVDDAATVASVKKFYKYQRTILWDYNKTPYDLYRLKSHTVINTTTLTDLTGWITMAKAQKSWLVLLYHRVRTPAVNATEVTPTTFASHMSIIQNSGLPVRPMGEVLGVWSTTKGGGGDGGTATSDSSTTVSDLGGNPWGDFYNPLPGPDAGFGPNYDASTADQGVYSMPRPWPLDDDGLCSVSPASPADALPGLGIILAVGLTLLRRRS